jgi:cyanophycinase
MSLKSGLIASLLFLFLSIGLQAKSFKYARIGNKADVQTVPTAGIAMMGGGADLDDAFRWLCTRANGGDFLILRARGSNDYNPYVNGLCKLNSVATLVISDRDAALDPKVADIIRHAEAIFIAGGNQARYINFWRTSPVQDAINDHLAEGKPLGGTSAGLAVEGEYVYSAMNDRSDGPDLTSAMALANPYHPQVAVVRDFLRVPHLQNLITDSHFAKRDRLGRSLVFLARIVQNGWSKDPREIAIDERSAVLVDGDGKGVVVGTGKGAYFIQVTTAAAACKPGVPLSITGLVTYHAPSDARFDLSAWHGTGGESYTLSVESSAISSNRPDQSLY